MRILLLFSFLLIPFCVISQHAEPDYSGIQYSSGKNNWLNIYLAEGEGKKPLLVFAHANGSTADRFPLGVWNELKEIGVSAISWESVPNIKDFSDYRTCTEDFLQVLNWIQNNADAYGFDMENIIVCGRSRGSVVSWIALHTYPEKFKGAYMAQALPSRTWEIRDYTKDVKPESPVLFFAFADGPDTNDGHTPMNGLKIKEAYDLNGIADRFFIEHSLGKQELYKFLIDFIQKNVN
jgi:pimeloyl-ACP methyl ester carboxylesterase